MTPGKLPASLRLGAEGGSGGGGVQPASTAGCIAATYSPSPPPTEKGRATGLNTGGTGGEARAVVNRNAYLDCDLNVTVLGVACGVGGGGRCRCTQCAGTGREKHSIGAPKISGWRPPRCERSWSPVRQACVVWSGHEPSPAAGTAA